MRISLEELAEQIAGLSPAKRALLERKLRQGAGGRSDEALPRRSDRGPAPLSFAQQRLWFLEQLDPGLSVYNVPVVLKLRGRLDAALLRRSLEEIVRLHEALRTTFPASAGEPVQVISSEPSLELPVVDLRGLPEAERGGEALRLAREEVGKPFDLTQGPLIRGRLFQLADEDYLFALTMHHIASDAWSIGVFFRELALLYGSRAPDSRLPELPIQYADFAVWQRDWLRGDVLEEQLSYWTRQLAGAPPLLELPTDRPRPLAQTFRGARHRITLPASLAEGLRSLARRERATLFMTLLAAFEVLLSRYTGREDILVGVPAAGRNRLETEGLIGFFVNTLVFRGNLSGDPTFPEFLLRMRQVALDAYSHEDLPFERLVEELQPHRSLSYPPLFQVMFQLMAEPQAPRELADLKLEPVDLDSGIAKFDLSLGMSDQDGGLSAFFEYNTDLFDEETIRRWMRHWQVLLEGIAADPGRRLSELPLLTEQEGRQLVEWNETAVEFPREKRVQELFEEQVERTPDAVALVSEEERLTYRELNRRANRLAHYLHRIGVGPDVPVGLCVERSAAMVAGLLAILKAGGAYVPLDPAWPRERLAFVLEDTGAPVLLMGSSVAGISPPTGARILLLDSAGAGWQEESAENPAGGANPENLAYVIYTSGSTGRPKGVQVAHRALVNHALAAAQRYGLERRDRVLQFASLSFDVAAEEIFPTLARGASLVLRTDTMLDTVSSFLDRCRDWNLTVLNLPTAYWHELAGALAAGRLSLPERLRLVIIGGESALPERVREWNGAVQGRVALLNAYGPTEATVTATVYDPARRNGGLASVPIGRPIANTRVYILDRALRPAPIGVFGELCIAGDGLARGYRNRPELTAERFRPDPYASEPGARLCSTGDLARYLPDGNIEFRGRLDSQVKVRGFRIEPLEIEATLARHPGVRDVAVVAFEERPGEKRLAAYFVPHAKPGPAIRELRGYLVERLPEYMVPSAFLALESLPRTPSGKVDRRALPAPDPGRPAAAGRATAPRTPDEEALAAIWRAVLNVPEVGVHDNFFELGGHSLLAIRVFSRIRDSLGVGLPLRALFETPTVAQLAGAIASARDAGAAPAPFPPPIAAVSRRALAPRSRDSAESTSESSRKA